MNNTKPAYLCEKNHVYGVLPGLVDEEGRAHYEGDPYVVVQRGEEKGGEGQEDEKGDAPGEHDPT